MRSVHLVGFLLLAGAVQATTVREMSLAEVTAEADLIFLGTVATTTSVEGGPPHDLLFTAVSFTDLDVLKGSVSDSSLTLRFGGGRVGDRRVVVPGMPQFTPGERIVLFTHSRGGLCPTVGWHQGCYRVRDGIVLGPEGIATLAAFRAAILEEAFE